MNGCIEREKPVFKRKRMDISIRMIHFGIMFFALAAYLTADGAGDYKRADYSGYILHKWLGMGAAIFILIRIVYGLLGPEGARFSSWVPYTKERLYLAREGLASVFLYRKPGRQAHQGIAGLINFSGLIIFCWIGLTGSLLYFFLEPGRRAGGLVHLIKEVHEVGETLVPVYLLIHIGAVVIHALYGRDIWRKMLFIKK